MPKKNKPMDQNGTPTLDELKKFFQENDFTTAVSGYDFENASEEDNRLYLKIKNLFGTAWNGQMKELTGTGSLANFSKDAPVKCLEKADEDLIAGTIMESLQDDTLTEMYGQISAEVVAEPLAKELEKYAEEHGKTVDDLTEEEIGLVMDDFSNRFLGNAVNMLQQTQSVPEIMDISSKMAAHEDFASTKGRNYDKIDFRRRWYHLRAKIDTTLSYDEIVENEFADPESTAAFSTLEDSMDQDELYQMLLGAVCDSCDDDIDRQIIRMCDEQLTQKEIAERLGYKSQGAVSKRLKKLRKRYSEIFE